MKWSHVNYRSGTDQRKFASHKTDVLTTEPRGGNLGYDGLLAVSFSLCSRLTALWRYMISHYKFFRISNAVKRQLTTVTQ